MNWIPIDDAPEDGLWALVYADGAINCAFVKKGKYPEDWTEPACPNAIPELVTHWMPLPSPPSPPPPATYRHLPNDGN